MSTPIKVKLSGSTSAKPIMVPQSGTSATVHSASSTLQDFVNLQAWNIDTVDRLLTIELGGTTANERQTVTVPAQAGRITVLDRKLMQSGLVLSAFGTGSSVLMLDGDVTRV